MKQYKLWVEEQSQIGIFDPNEVRGYLEYDVDQEITLTFKPYEINVILNELESYNKFKLTNGKQITHAMRGFIGRSIQRQLLEGIDK